MKRSQFGTGLKYNFRSTYHGVLETTW